MGMPELVNPIQWATPIFILMVVAEMFYGYRTGRVRYEWRDTATSLLMGVGSQFAGLIQKGAVLGLGYWVWSNWRVFDIGWQWWAFVAAFLAEDLAYYCVHRAGHRIRWFWAAHVIHHSSQHYNLSTALRQTWTGFIALNFAFRLPLFVIGFHPLMIAFVGALNLIYQFWIHTEAIVRLPVWFEAIFNTPSHHRVHHAVNPEYLDSNYAGTLIVWDRLFGTFVREDPAEPCRYGIVKQLGTFNPLNVAFHEWLGILHDLARARSWREIWGYIWKPPGWRPEGGVTSDEIKRRWRAHRRCSDVGPTPSRSRATAAE